MEEIPYGADPLQYGELRLPATGGPHPIAIVLHGGFWRARYNLEYMRPFCEALTAAGIATWNLEYRRIGNPGGGWPGTLDDAATGAEHVTSLSLQFDLDLSHVVAVGHSAGAHLAFWLAGGTRILTAAISLAGVLDLRRAWELQLSNNVVTDFLGGSPDELPERYDSASPIERLPLRIPQKVFHGTADTNVPFEISERYVEAAHLWNDDVELILFQDGNHFDLIDPAKQDFISVSEAVVKLAGR